MARAPFLACESVRVSVRHIFRNVSQLFRQLMCTILTNARLHGRLVAHFSSASAHVDAQCVGRLAE